MPERDKIKAQILYDWVDRTFGAVAVKLFL
jgi:hypothetical protein